MNLFLLLKTKHKKALLITRGFSVLLLMILLLTACKGKTDVGADTTPPTFVGVKDIEVFVGEGAAFRTGVSAMDDRDGEVAFTVDTVTVDFDTAGVYTVTYRAADKAGNEAVKIVKVTVKQRTIDPTQLWEYTDALIAREGWKRLSTKAYCTEIYYYIKENTSYISTSDKSDWVKEAYRGFTEHTGDCFTYYAMARAIFERMGVELMEVTRAEGVLPTTHYWLLLNTGSKSAPEWYHWDACPHPMEHPLESILLTDAELLAYNAKVEHYYTFDQSKYPSTPTAPYQE